MKLVSRSFMAALALSILLASILACGTTPTQPVTSATPSEPPTQTSLPIQTPVPLFQQVTLVSVPQSEKSQAPVFTVKAQIPNLQGSEDARVKAFNDEMT